MDLTFEQIAAVLAIVAALIGIYMNLQNMQKAASNERAEQVGRAAVTQTTLEAIKDGMKRIETDVSDMRGEFKATNEILTKHELRIQALEANK